MRLRGGRLDSCSWLTGSSEGRSRLALSSEPLPLAVWEQLCTEQLPGGRRWWWVGRHGLTEQLYQEHLQLLSTDGTCLPVTPGAPGLAPWKADRDRSVLQPNNTGNCPPDPPSAPRDRDVGWLCPSFCKTCFRVTQLENNFCDHKKVNSEEKRHPNQPSEEQSRGHLRCGSRLSWAPHPRPISAVPIGAPVAAGVWLPKFIPLRPWAGAPCRCRPRFPFHLKRQGPACCRGGVSTRSSHSILVRLSGKADRRVIRGGDLQPPEGRGWGGLQPASEHAPWVAFLAAASTPFSKSSNFRCSFTCGRQTPHCTLCIFFLDSFCRHDIQFQPEVPRDASPASRTRHTPLLGCPGFSERLSPVPPFHR